MNTHTNENVPAVDLSVAPDSGEDVSTTTQQEEGATPMVSQNKNKDELVAEGRALFDRYVLPERERRDDSLGHVLGALIVSYSDDTSATEEDRRAEDEHLAVAYRVAADRDKVLGFWTATDLRDAADDRLLNPYFQEQAEHFIKALGLWAVTTISELFSAQRVQTDMENSWYPQGKDDGTIVVTGAQRIYPDTIISRTPDEMGDEEMEDDDPVTPEDRMKGADNARRIAAEMIEGGFATFGDWAAAKFGPKPTD